MDKKRSIAQIIRILHRNIGFFLIGYMVIYALSGITLIFRDSNFLKMEKKVKVTLPATTKPSELGSALRIRELKILENNGEVITFQGGSFNKVTGEAEYTIKELMFPFNKMTVLHKVPSKNPLHWFSLGLGILLLLMAITSPWMFKPNTKIFKKGMIVVSLGILFAILLLVLV